MESAVDPPLIRPPHSRSKPRTSARVSGQSPLLSIAVCRHLLRSADIEFGARSGLAPSVECQRRHRTWSRACARQRTIPSLVPVTTVCPSGWKAAQRTASARCSRRTRLPAPDSESRNRARAIVAGRQEHGPVWTEGHGDDLSCILARFIEHRTGGRVPNAHRADMTARHQLGAFGVEGDGGDRVRMTRAVFGINLYIAVRVPQSSPAIPATDQQGPAIPAENGLVDWRIEALKERTRHPQRGRVPQPGRFRARTAVRQPFRVGAVDQARDRVGLFDRLPEMLPRCRVPEF